MLYLWRADAFIYRLWKNVYDRSITSNFPCKWHRTASTTSGWKSSPAKIFHRKLLWRTAIKIHRERRRRRRQQDLQEWHRLAQRRKRRLHSDHKHVQKGSDKPQLHCKGKMVKRENTDCRRFTKQWGDQSTLEVYSQNYLLRCKSYTICTMHVKNIFPIYWGQPMITNDQHHDQQWVLQ